MSFFHLRRDRAKKLLRLMWEDSELFYVNEKKNCVFAKSCRDKSIKISRRGDKYCNDDIIKIQVPECYLSDKSHKESLALNDLVRLIERVLVCKEYDDRTGYKYSTGDRKGCKDICETEVRKTQLYVAKRTGLNRTKVGRILREYISLGLMAKTDAHIERCKKGEMYSFEAINKKTRLTYWAKCVPPVFSWIKEAPFKFMNIIWDARKRARSKFAKSAEKIKNEIIAASTVDVSISELEFKAMVARQMQLRDLYD